MVKVTNHGKQRLKERNGFNVKSIDRMAEKVYQNGLCHSETSGQLNKWITKLYFTGKVANEIRIYGDKAYLFNGETLITVLQVPNNLLKAVRADKKRKEEKTCSQN